MTHAKYRVTEPFLALSRTLSPSFTRSSDTGTCPSAQWCRGARRGRRLPLRPAPRRGGRRRRLPGCQRTPTVKRRAGSSSASTVPSSACAATRRPSPIRPKPWWWCDFTGTRLAEHRSEPRAGLDLDVVVGEGARCVLVPLVADDVRQVLHEVAAERDVQHLRAAADREHRQVALERRAQQRELGVVALRARSRSSRDAPPGRRAPGRGRSRRRRSARRARRASPRFPRSTAARAAPARPRARPRGRSRPGPAPTRAPRRRTTPG